MGGKNGTEVKTFNEADGGSDGSRGLQESWAIEAFRAEREERERASSADRGSQNGGPEIDKKATQAPERPNKSSTTQGDSKSHGVIIRAREEGGYDLEDQATGTKKMLTSDMVRWFNRRNTETLQGSLAFVPWILQQAYFEGGFSRGSNNPDSVGGNLEDNIVMHRGSGAVVFSDASGFTALTERLAKKANGAELLSQCLTAFFTPLIQLINAYRGDVIKFSGDALMIYFPAVDDTRAGMLVPPHGSYGFPDIGPMATAVLRASACCIEIHKRLHMFDTGVDGVRLCLHIGVGCGEVAMLQVGGIVPPETHVPRCEYIICGPPLEQISIAEPLAKNGETCLSPQAWEHVRECVVEGSPLEDRPDYHLLLRMDESKFTFPTIKYSAMETDTRSQHMFRLSELNVIRRYIPSAVFKQIEGGTLTYVNEMRNISTIFISGSGVDVSTDDGAQIAQNLMSSVQRMCYSHEGTLNKFVIDDKGMLFLLVYGLPPLVHTDDSTRAVLACFDMVKVFRDLNLIGRFGVTTGRAYCGVCGSAQRMEYTVLGDTVNLSARLMANAPANGVYSDESTKDLSTNEINFQALAAIKVKGKANPIPIFQPCLSQPPQFIGLGPNGRLFFPWHERSQLAGSSTASISKDASDGKPMTHEMVMKANLSQICGLPDWDGIVRVQSLLGGHFSSDLHKRESFVSRAAVPRDRSKTPQGSPFDRGGLLVIEGATGTGKIELAEHVIVFTATQLRILPVFGSMGPRLGDQERLGVELLRSTLGVFRYVDNTLPQDDIACIVRVLPSDCSSFLPTVRDALSPQPEEDSLQKDKAKMLDTLIEIVMTLLEVLRKQTPILVVLQLEVGTSLFSKTIDGFSHFWKVVTKFHEISAPEKPNPEFKPLTMLVLCKNTIRSHPAVREAIKKGWFVKTSGLSDDNSIEYMAKYLNVPKQMLPQPLRQFIVKITLGNPLYIRETIDQLIHHTHIKLQLNANGQPESLHYHQDLEGINIASWAQTAMVGETVCLLESLDPLEAAVVKMGTVFSGPFTLPDLASSSCSRWAGATHFDYLRLFRAIQNLVKREIIEFEDKSARTGGQADWDNTFYVMRNVLIRKVGASMVLEAQKKAVKRQALIDRVLSRDLPARMEEVWSKRREPHIPWYYENVLNKAA